MAGRTNFSFANLRPLFVRLTYALSGLAAQRILRARELKGRMPIVEAKSSLLLSDSIKKLHEVENRRSELMEMIDYKTDIVPLIDSYDEDVMATKVFGVREAKDGLSRILKRASEGDWSIIESSQGKSVVVVSADQLLGGLEKQNALTLAEALRQLPYRLDRLEKPKMRGRPPRRGLLHANRTGRQSTLGGLGHS